MSRNIIDERKLRKAIRRHILEQTNIQQDSKKKILKENRDAFQVMLHR